MNIHLDWSWLFPAICLGLVLLALMVRYPKIWLGVLILALPLYLADTGKGVSVTESISGGIYTVSLLFWLVWHIGSRKRSIIRSWPDFLLVMFVCLTACNVVLAKFNGTALFGWAVDWSFFLLMLYYFPLREVFGDSETSFKHFMYLCGASSVLMAAYTGLHFRNRMAENMVYAYQIVASRSVLLGPFFVIAICIATAVFFHTQLRGKVLSALVILINFGALVLTFTRTLWVFTFICIAIIMVFLSARQNISLVASVLGLVSVTVIGFYAYSPKLADLGVRLIQRRFTSSTQLSGGDRSFETRLIEVNNAWRKVKLFPLGGSGLRARFVTWQPIEGWHNDVSFVHIGYVGLLHKVGFPLAIVMFATLLGFNLQALRNAWALRKHRDARHYRAVAIGALAFFPALYVTIFMAGIFDQRYGNVLMAFLFASVALTGQHVQRIRSQRNQHVASAQ
ncbi:MAG: hypothetical protein RLZZ273_520 [Bacteroidota bacterium]